MIPPLSHATICPAVTLDLRTGKVSEPFMQTTSSLTEVAWSPDGKQIVVANGWNGSELGIRPIAGKALPVVQSPGTPIQWLSDSRRLLTVALHKDGSQTIDTPAEFQQKFGWNNDPQKVTFLKLRDRAK